MVWFVIVALVCLAGVSLFSILTVKKAEADLKEAEEELRRLIEENDPYTCNTVIEIEEKKLKQ